MNLLMTIALSCPALPSPPLPDPPLCLPSRYVEYDRMGRVVKGVEVKARSRYDEDMLFNNHTKVWGSWWKEGRWGYACCHNTLKNSYCTGGWVAGWCVVHRWVGGRYCTGGWVACRCVVHRWVGGRLLHCTGGWPAAALLRRWWVRPKLLLLLLLPLCLLPL